MYCTSFQTVTARASTGSGTVSFSVPVYTSTTSPSTCSYLVITGQEYLDLVAATNLNASNVSVLDNKLSALSSLVSTLRSDLSSSITNSQLALSSSQDALRVAGDAYASLSSFTSSSNNGLLPPLDAVSAAQIAGAILLVWASAWGFKALITFFNFSQGDSNNET